MLVKRWNTLIFYAGVHRWKVGGKIFQKQKRLSSSVSASDPPWLDAEYSLCTGLFLALKGIKLRSNFTSLISHCHKEMKKVYLEGGWYFQDLLSHKFRTLGSLQAVKQFRCSSWQCVCKRYFINCFATWSRDVTSGHTGLTAAPGSHSFWHVLFESPLRIYVLLQNIQHILFCHQSLKPQCSIHCGVVVEVDSLLWSLLKFK